MKAVFLLLLLFRDVSGTVISYKGITEEDRVVRTTQHYSYALDRLNQRNLPLDNQYYDGKFTGRGIDVYIIDTGISQNSYYPHTCGFNFLGDPSNCSTTAIHGTHVGSLVASTLFGMAPGSTIINLRVLDDNGYGLTSTVIQALDYILHHNITCSVINMSIGGPKSLIMNMKVNEIVRAGNRVVVAAGNNGDDACKYSPASARKAITVGAINRYDRIPFFSNTGTCIDVYAPGDEIIGAFGKDRVGYISGTSMSSPLVSGILASRMQQKGCRARYRRKRIAKRIRVPYLKG